VTSLLVAEVAVLQRFPVKSMGGERLEGVDVLSSGLVGDREWAVYGADGKLASGKHSARFRRMDSVFELVARRDGDDTFVVLPDGAEHVAGEPRTDDVLSQHFGEPVWLRRETDVMHQDQATFSLVGSATLVELGRHEGDGRTMDPRSARANVVVETDEPYAEESWIGREVTVGAARVGVTQSIQRCRMVGVAQVGLPERRGMLQAVSDHHELMAGVYATVLRPGRVAVGDGVRPA